MNGLLRVAICGALVLASAVAHAQVCQLKTDRGQYGSAVCVGTYDRCGDAVFLTAGHCVSATGTFVAPEGRWVRAEPVAWFSGGPGKDLGFLRCPSYKPERTYSLGDRSPTVGSEVSVCGFARAGQLEVRRTRIGGHGNGWIDLDCPGVRGVSGGPVLDGRRVVGILTHNNDELNCGVATNAETIARALRDWGVCPGAKPTSQWSLGFGVGGQCGPWGCQRPMYPVIPTQPYYVAPVQPRQPYYESPQQPYVESPPEKPGYPGWDTRPERPTTPATPAAPDDSGLADLKKRLDASEESHRKALDELKAAIGGLSLRAGEPGAPGERGPRGPEGPPGPAGKDADGAALSELRGRISALEGVTIPVEVVDGNGSVVSRDSVKLGQPIRLRFRPQYAE